MGAYAGPEIVNDGLVLHLDAANEQSYPGSGTVWFDLSGNGNDGVLINSPSFVNNNLGYFFFDGVNDFVNCGNNNSLDLQSLTCCHILYTQWDSSWSPFIGKHGSDNNYRFWLDQNKNWDVQNTPGGSNIKPFYTANEVNSNEFYYLSFTIDAGNTGKFYINDKLVQTRSCSIGTINNRELYLGFDGGSAYGSGGISQLFLYNRALSKSEIKQNFNALRGRYGI